MSLRSGVGLFLTVLIGVVSCLPAAFAWDRHVYITQHALRSLKRNSPADWRRLTSKVEVTPIEQFLEKAFGSECASLDKLDAIFDGLGKRYRVRYVEGVRAWFTLDWERGISHQHHDDLPFNPKENSQAIGEKVLPYDVLSIYSDEADWSMDDDVPRLKGKGNLSKEIEGSGTRVLRHFWYEGEKHFGVDFGADQETDERMHLFFELAAVAFKVGEPYWGYRFLGNALHYIQDITQPYHSRGMITSKMFDNLGIMQAVLCDYHRKNDLPLPETCLPQDTLKQIIIKNGWVVAAYHALYEDFVLALMVEQRFGSRHYVSDVTGHYKRQFDIPELSFGGNPNWPDMRQALRFAHSVIEPIAEMIGEYSYKTFGHAYKYNAEKAAREHLLHHISTTHSWGYLIGKHGDTLEDEVRLSRRQAEALGELVVHSHLVLAHAGAWTRDVVTNTLRAIDSSSHFYTEALRLKFQARCSKPQK